MTDIMLKLTKDEAELLVIELEAVLLTDFPEPDPESDHYEKEEHDEWKSLESIYRRLHGQLYP